MKEKKYWYDKWLINLLSFVIALLSLGWSCYTHIQLLPTQRAIISFPFSNEVPLCKKNLCSGLERDNLYVCDADKAQALAIEPVLKNIGRSRADDVSFKIYGIYLVPSSNILASSSAQLLFNEKLVHDLSPEMQTPFGTITFDITGKEVLLIFHLEYVDSLTKESVNEDFWYKYTISPGNLNRPYSFMQSEKDKIDKQLLKNLFQNDSFMLKKI